MLFDPPVTSTKAAAVGVSGRSRSGRLACAQRSIPPKLRPSLTGTLLPRRLDCRSVVTASDAARSLKLLVNLPRGRQLGQRVVEAGEGRCHPRTNEGDPGDRRKQERPH